MKEIRKQQLIREALDFLLCVVIAVLLALAVDYRIREVAKQTIETYQRDQQRTEWVKAAHEASEVTLGGYDSNK